MSLIGNRPDLLPSRGKKISYFALLSSLFISIVLAIIVLFVIYEFFYYPYKNLSDAMEPAIKKNEIIWLEKNPDLASIKKGDIVLVKAKYQSADASSASITILRVAATANDKIEIKNKKVFVNEKAEKLNYKIIFKDAKRFFPEAQSGRDNLIKTRIRKNKVFLLADNRDEGFDSRYFGTLPVTNILARLKN